MKWLWARIKVVVAVLKWPYEPDRYVVHRQINYHSPRYGKWVRVPLGFGCDHATGSPNIGRGPILHDWLFSHGLWCDGTHVLFRQANNVMVDYMRDVEHQPWWVVHLYRAGIKTRWSLRAWRQHRQRDKLWDPFREM